MYRSDSGGIFAVTSTGNRSTILPGQSISLARLPVVGVSLDGLSLAQCANRTIVTTDLAARTDQCTFTTHKRIEACVFAPNNRHLLVLYEGQSVAMWDTKTGRLLHESTQLPVKVTSIAYSPCGWIFALGTDNGMILVFETATLKQRFALRAHNGTVSCLSFSGSEAWLVASGGADGRVMVWDLGLENRKLCKRFVFDESWQLLASNDPKVAFHAMGELRSIRSLPLLASMRLQETFQVPEELVRDYVAKLDSDNYRVRVMAMQELANISEVAEPVLKEILNEPVSLDLNQA